MKISLIILLIGIAFAAAQADVDSVEDVVDVAELSKDETPLEVTSENEDVLADNDDDDDDDVDDVMSPEEEEDEDVSDVSEKDVSWGRRRCSSARRRYYARRRYFSRRRYNYRYDGRRRYNARRRYSTPKRLKPPRRIPLYTPRRRSPSRILRRRHHVVRGW